MVAAPGARFGSSPLSVPVRLPPRPVRLLPSGTSKPHTRHACLPLTSSPFSYPSPRTAVRSADPDALQAALRPGPDACVVCGAGHVRAVHLRTQRRAAVPGGGQHGRGRGAHNKPGRAGCVSGDWGLEGCRERPRGGRARCARCKGAESFTGSSHPASWSVLTVRTRLRSGALAP